MKWLITLIVQIAFCSALAAQPSGRIDDARSLRNACAPVAHSIENPKRKAGVPLEAGLLCLGYMQAMQDISVLTDAEGQSVLGACPSQNTKLSDLIRAFVGYADVHPAELGDSAAVVVIKSLRRTFPCGANRTPGHPPENAAEQPGRPKPP